LFAFFIFIVIGVNSTFCETFIFTLALFAQINDCPIRTSMRHAIKDQEITVSLQF